MDLAYVNGFLRDVQLNFVSDRVDNNITCWNQSKTRAEDFAKK